MSSLIHRLHPIEKQALVFHLIFAGICLLVLFAPINLAVGLKMLFLVILYNILTPIWGWLQKDAGWLNIWLFALILSIFQVFPDWFLADQLDILVFPADGCFKIGAVSGYMAGLWAIPIFISVFVGERLQHWYSTTAAYIGVGVVSFILFTGSEQTLWLLPAWHAKNVFMIGHTAIYIVIPEIILGLTAFFAFQQVKTQGIRQKIIAAFLVMQLYLGSAAFFYFVIERVLVS